LDQFLDKADLLIKYGAQFNLSDIYENPSERLKFLEGLHQANDSSSAASVGGYLFSTDTNIMHDILCHYRDIPFWIEIYAKDENIKSAKAFVDYTGILKNDGWKTLPKKKFWGQIVLEKYQLQLDEVEKVIKSYYGVIDEGDLISEAVCIARKASIRSSANEVDRVLSDNLSEFLKSRISSAVEEKEFVRLLNGMDGQLVGFSATDIEKSLNLSKISKHYVHYSYLRSPYSEIFESTIKSSNSRYVYMDISTLDNAFIAEPKHTYEYIKHSIKNKIPIQFSSFWEYSYYEDKASKACEGGRGVLNKSLQFGNSCYHEGYSFLAGSWSYLWGRDNEKIQTDKKKEKKEKKEKIGEEKKDPNTDQKSTNSWEGVVYGFGIGVAAMFGGTVIIGLYFFSLYLTSGVQRAIEKTRDRIIEEMDKYDTRVEKDIFHEKMNPRFMKTPFESRYKEEEEDKDKDKDKDKDDDDDDDPENPSFKKIYVGPITSKDAKKTETILDNNPPVPEEDVEVEIPCLISTIDSNLNNNSEGAESGSESAPELECVDDDFSLETSCSSSLSEGAIILEIPTMKHTTTVVEMHAETLHITSMMTTIGSDRGCNVFSLSFEDNQEGYLDHTQYNGDIDHQTLI
jgi:hypothetical protein